jgi:hypothetical protein
MQRTLGYAPVRGRPPEAFRHHEVTGLTKKLKRAVAGLVGVVAVVVTWWAVTASVGSAQGLPPPATNTELGTLISPQSNIGASSVLTTPSMDYLYSETIGPPYVRVRRFHTLGDWLGTSSPLPQLPAWADPHPPQRGTGPLWSPAVAKVGRRYVLWFSAPYANPSPVDGQAEPSCIGYAVSASPTGPFRSPGQVAPPLCQMDQLGDTNPQPVKFGHQWWLYWKSDNGAGPRGGRAVMWAQRLAPDGTTLQGQPTVIFKAEKPWEQRVVDTPQMVRAGGRYYLFFSGAGKDTPDAGLGLAYCSGPAGPCHSPYRGPWLGASALGSGPSEVSVFSQDGASWLLYTASATASLGEPTHLGISRVAFGPTGPYVAALDGATPGQ